MTTSRESMRQTGLRLPADLDRRTREVARRSGVSQNSLIKIILAGALARESNQTPLTADELAAGEAAVASAVEHSGGEEPA